MSIVSKEMVVFAGLLAVPAATAIEQKIPQVPEKKDERLTALKQFFTVHGCPLHSIAGEFLKAADENDLDWRLLPSISLIESGGGRACRNNNVLGWGSANQKFPSVRAGIRTVAARLANSKLYRDKDTDQILATYNPNPEYPGRVRAVMRTIWTSGPRAQETGMN